MFFLNIIEDTIKRKYAGILNKNMMEGNIRKLNNQKQFALCREMCHVPAPLSLTGFLARLAFGLATLDLWQKIMNNSGAWR